MNCSCSTSRSDEEYHVLTSRLLQPQPPPPQTNYSELFPPLTSFPRCRLELPTPVFYGVANDILSTSLCWMRHCTWSTFLAAAAHCANGKKELAPVALRAGTELSSKQYAHWHSPAAFCWHAGYCEVLLDGAPRRQHRLWLPWSAIWHISLQNCTAEENTWLHFPVFHFYSS